MYIIYNVITNKDLAFHSSSHSGSAICCTDGVLTIIAVLLHYF